MIEEIVRFSCRILHFIDLSHVTSRKCKKKKSKILVEIQIRRSKRFQE